ncbi:MAG: SLATT domain-containing protein [Nitrospirae bacterium]|nr:SLATT domain-containing protein [Nitrospirota bacterium]
MTKPVPKNDFDRKIIGPDSYEYFNDISKICQKKYMGLLKGQIGLLLGIACISVIPPITKYENIQLFAQLILIVIVLILMVIQYKENYVAGWQKARFLSESIMSNCWLFIFKYENYDTSYEKALLIFHARIKEMKKEIDINKFLSITKTPNNDSDNPKWIMNSFDKNIDDKKNIYIKQRIADQIRWYTKKADYNAINSKVYFLAGLICMVTGMLLTILVLMKYIPNLSYLGFFTTIAASIFSWTQTKRFEELKTTYSVTADELNDFKKLILNSTSEAELREIIFSTEKAISREHKLWFSKVIE